MHQRAFVFAHHHTLERAFFGDAEHHDIELLLAAKGKRGGIHHFQVFIQGFIKGDGLIAGG